MGGNGRGPRPFRIPAGQRGAGGGNQALKPLALTSHLRGLRGGGGGGSPPRARVDGGSRRVSPPGELWVSPRAPAPSSESAFLTVCAMWIPPRGRVEQGRRGAGWGGLQCRGVELGVNCIETSPPKQGRPGAERPSPQRAQPGACTRQGRTLRRKFLPRVPVPRRHAGSPHNPLLPLSLPCPPRPPGRPLLPAAGVLAGPPPSPQPLRPHSAEAWPASGRGGLAGCPAPWGLGRGTRPRSPGPGRRRGAGARPSGAGSQRR